MAGALVVSSALVPFGPKAASAATIPGLDPAFGDAGLVFSPTMQTLPALAATPDGGVLIGAFFDGTSSIRRYTPNGTFDPTFAPASTTPGSISASLGSGLEIDGAGRIYAAGPTTFDPKIVRYLPDGQVDPTFDLPPWSDSFSRFEVLPNGDVVAMSTTSVDSTLVRFSSDGHLDTSFNPAGVNPGTVELTTLSATDFAVRPDGSVIVVGQSANHGAIARVSSSGTIDSSFGAQAAVDQLAVVWNVAVDNANRVVLAVPVSDGEQTQLIRLTPDGLVDASFGASGRITVAARGAWPGDLVVDASGRIVLGGNDPNVDAAVFRFLADGSPDPTLSGGGVPNGRLRVPVGERSNVSALFPLPDGRLVIGGVESISLTEQRGFVARLLGTATATSGGGFNPVAPNRILDTRNGIGAPASKLVPGSRIHLKVTGTPDIPTTGVAAVTMNVTVSSANSSGYVTVFPCNIEEPVVSNLNYAAGQDVPNLVTVPVAPDGTACFTTSATTHVIADIAGWYGVNGLGFNPVQPNRILDTRNGIGSNKLKLRPGETLRLRVAGTTNIPIEGATGAVLNVTATRSESGGYVTAFPCGIDEPVVSNLNFRPGQDVANLVTVPIADIGWWKPDHGSVCFTSSAPVDLLADVAGWFGTSGAGFNPVPPDRILDTRHGIGAPAGKLVSGSRIHLRVTGTGNLPTSGVTAVVLNTTVTGPDSHGFLTVFPCDITQPVVSNLNFSAGQDVPNLVSVPVSNDGTVCITTSATTHVIADIAGWYSQA